MKFIQTDKRSKAIKAMPGAAKIVKVIGGYMCFESIDEWITWTKQV